MKRTQATLNRPEYKRQRTDIVHKDNNSIECDIEQQDIRSLHNSEYQLQAGNWKSIADLADSDEGLNFTAPSTRESCATATSYTSLNSGHTDSESPMVEEDDEDMLNDAQKMSTFHGEQAILSPPVKTTAVRSASAPTISMDSTNSHLPVKGYPYLNLMASKRGTHSSGVATQLSLFARAHERSQSAPAKALQRSETCRAGLDSMADLGDALSDIELGTEECGICF